MPFDILVAVVAAIHGYIVVLEMLMWESPRARRVFGTTATFAAETKALAFNQGLYNGFLVAGLLLGLFAGNALLVTFILVCVVVAGLVGLASGVRSAFLFQTIPAALALLARWVGL